MSPIDVKAADDNRDSLAKTLYQRLFDWLVDKINSSIGQDPSAATLVGVLDIYGAKPQQPLLPFIAHCDGTGVLSCQLIPSWVWCHVAVMLTQSPCSLYGSAAGVHDI